ncbi:MAG: YdcF family protein [Leptolyngbya sp. SIOISBB]|nr:YdcF family protein [Leptolyngbya sp. SIOISBB]
MNSIDAVLIPGGGLAASGDVLPWVQARLERAIALRPSPQFFIPLSAGTPHKPPPMDVHGFPILESVAAAHYLQHRGIEGARILPETVSLDTVGNAYFARLQHIEPLQLRRLHVITSAFHLPRTQAIFEWVFALSPCHQPVHLTFEAVPNIGMVDPALQARCDLEQASLAKFQTLQTRFTQLAEVHRWLYREHGAYAIAQTPQKLNNEALGTY